jgi:hypothetical protein
MVDPTRTRRQAKPRAWKTGCQAPERAGGNDAASLVRLGNCRWAEQFDPTGVSHWMPAEECLDGAPEPPA